MNFIGPMIAAQTALMASMTATNLANQTTQELLDEEARGRAGARNGGPVGRPVTQYMRLEDLTRHMRLSGETAENAARRFLTEFGPFGYGPDMYILTHAEKLFPEP